MFDMKRNFLQAVGLLMLAIYPLDSQAADAPAVVRTAGSGLWSAARTWEGGQLPQAGQRVQIREGHAVVYDIQSSAVLRSVHIGGTLSFASDKDTRLETGLIKIQAGDDVSEEGFDCEGHMQPPAHGAPRPALLVGTQLAPIDAAHTAIIRLHYIEGMNRETCPAIVCCAGQMEFHGAPVSRTWVKLGQPAKAGAREIELTEAVAGWRVGDRLIVTATTRQNKVKKTFKTSTHDGSQTEERLITSIDATRVTLDKPLEFDHFAEGDYRADVANLSRNVIVESADPDGVRGHTMYHQHSAGSIGYAEFRHLGKPGVLGKYSLHFHLVGDTMRGSSVIGASIWDSGNRWLTIHGTNYLVVRDCVGYQSRGHGFFLEDGTEVYNVLDRNLAVQAYITPPLPKQVIPFDKNDGSGFWWANCLNTFTRNVACDCDEYGYFFQAAKTADFDPVLPVRQPDGARKNVDIRTLPFVRFEDNEAHCQRRHAFNLGGGVPFGEPNVGGVGPDEQHPFLIRNFRVWNAHWAIHPVAPSVLLDHMDVYNAEYGVWRPVYDRHAYRNVQMEQVPEKFHYAFTTGRPQNDESAFPKPLAPRDDLPPATVITHVIPATGGKLLVQGVTSDNGVVSRVLINGQPARATVPNFAQWELTVDAPAAGDLTLTAHAEDEAKNVELTPHVRQLRAP